MRRCRISEIWLRKGYIFQRTDNSLSVQIKVYVLHNMYYLNPYMCNIYSLSLLCERSISISICLYHHFTSAPTANLHFSAFLQHLQACRDVQTSLNWCFSPTSFASDYLYLWLFIAACLTFTGNTVTCTPTPADVFIQWSSRWIFKC